MNCETIFLEQKKINPKNIEIISKIGKNEIALFFKIEGLFSFRRRNPNPKDLPKQ